MTEGSGSYIGYLNRVMLIGNLGKDAELRYTQEGDAVASLSLATNETWTDKAGKKQERTEWHRCVLWGKTAENLAEYLVKGKQIYLEGRLQTRKWTDKSNIERYTTEIRVDRVTLLGKKDGGSGGGAAVPHPAETADDSEIPF